MEQQHPHPEEDSTKDDNKAGEKLHPLLVPPVVHNIIKYCNLKELCNFRQVCHTWHTESRSRWQKLSQMLYLRGYGKFPIGIVYRGTSTVAIDTYLEGVVNEQNLEYGGRRNYPKICLHSFDLGVDSEYLSAFQNHLSSWITQLKLRHVHFQDLTSFQKIYFSEWTPELKIFEAKVNYTFAPDASNPGRGQLEEQKVNKKLTILKLAFGSGPFGKLPVTWLELLQNYPNLEGLDIRYCNSNWAQELEQLLTACVTLRCRDKKSLPLKHFSIGHTIPQDGRFSLTQQHFDLFHDAAFPLEEVLINLDATPNPTLISQLLQFHSKSLKEVGLYFNPPTSFPPSVIPYMESLRKLRLMDGSKLNNLGFLKYLPNLEYLDIVEEPVTTEEDIQIQGIVHSTMDEDMGGVVKRSLKTFKYSTKQNSCTTVDIVKLSRWMPKLLGLKLFLTNETFRVVCLCWKKLEELEVVGNHLDDEGIAGIPSSRGLNSVVTHPTITNLQNLTSFIIKSQDTFIYRVRWLCMPMGITEISVLKGFLQLPNLSTLTFPVEMGLPYEVMEQLKQKVKNVTILPGILEWRSYDGIFLGYDSADDSEAPVEEL